jgi:hypothetical protein
MVKKMKTKYMLILLFFSILSCTAHASEIVPLHKLFEESQRYEENKVAVEGEVIGDIMRAGESFWINIKDGDFFLGIVINSAQKEQIRNLGRYGVRGDTVRISGIYRLHCKEHHGERDIHAEILEIVEEGRVFDESVNTNKILLSVVFGLATILTVFYSHRMRIRKDTGDPQN